MTPWEVLVLHSFLRPERPKPLPSTSEAMVLGLGICRDRYAVSLVGQGARFPEWGRNSDSEFRQWRFRDRSRDLEAPYAVRDVDKPEGRRNRKESDHTSTKAPDPIRTSKLRVLGRE